MELTIGIAVYNGENYIDRCITSILRAYKNIPSKKLRLQIIAVNDGSKDNSESILAEYEKNYDFIKVINKENGGPSSSRNKIIEQCNTKYLWFVDVDDEIELDSFKYLLIQNLGEINMFNYSTYTYNGDVVENNSITDMDEKDIKLIAYRTPSPWHFIFSTEFIKGTRLYFLENVFYEDLNYILKITSKVDKIKWFDKPIYRYYLSQNSIMRSNSLSKKIDIFLVFNDAIAYYRKNNIYESNYTELEYTAIHHLLYVGYLDVFKIDKKSELLDQYKKYLNENFPNWQHNKYYKKISLKRKLIYFLILANSKRALSLILKILN